MSNYATFSKIFALNLRPALVGKYATISSYSARFLDIFLNGLDYSHGQYDYLQKINRNTKVFTSSYTPNLPWG